MHSVLNLQTNCSKQMAQLTQKLAVLIPFLWMGLVKVVVNQRADYGFCLHVVDNVQISTLVDCCA